MTIATIITSVLGGAVPVQPAASSLITLFEKIPISLALKAIGLTYGPMIAIGIVIKNEDENDPEFLKRINRQFSHIKMMIKNLKKQDPNLDHGKKSVDQIARTALEQSLLLKEQRERDEESLKVLIEASKAIDINQIKDALDALFENLKEIEENIDLYLPILDDIKACNKEVKKAEELLKVAPKIIQALTKEIEEIAALIKELGEDESELIDQYLKKSSIFSEKLKSQLEEANIG